MRTMYDSTTPSVMPAGAPLYAGYVNGRWPTYEQVCVMHPEARVVSIAVTTSADADVLDVEWGDAYPTQAPAWAVRQRNRGAVPTVYCALNTWPEVKQAFQSAEVAEPLYWIADWDNNPTLPDGAVAKQYADSALLPANYDASIVADYWPGVDPASQPQPVSEDNVFELIHNTVTSEIRAWSAGGAWWHVPNPDWAKVCLNSPLCKGQRDADQAEFDMLAAIAASARGAAS